MQIQNCNLDYINVDKIKGDINNLIAATRPEFQLSALQLSLIPYTNCKTHETMLDQGNLNIFFTQNQEQLDNTDIITSYNRTRAITSNDAYSGFSINTTKLPEMLNKATTLKLQGSFILNYNIKTEAQTIRFDDLYTFNATDNKYYLKNNEVFKNYLKTKYPVDNFTNEYDYDRADTSYKIQYLVFSDFQPVGDGSDTIDGVDFIELLKNNQWNPLPNSTSTPISFSWSFTINFLQYKQIDLDKEIEIDLRETQNANGSLTEEQVQKIVNATIVDAISKSIQANEEHLFNVIDNDYVKKNSLEINCNKLSIQGFDQNYDVVENCEIPQVNRRLFQNQNLNLTNEVEKIVLNNHNIRANLSQLNNGGECISKDVFDKQIAEYNNKINQLQRQATTMTAIGAVNGIVAFGLLGYAIYKGCEKVIAMCPRRKPKIAVNELNQEAVAKIDIGSGENLNIESANFANKIKKEKTQSRY